MNTYDFHKVSTNDNMHQIGRLIYYTDPYVYPFWRPGERHFAQFIEPWIYAENFVYHYRNFCTISERRDRYPLGIIGGLSADAKLDFDYDIFGDERSRFVINYYIRNIIIERQSMPDDNVLITNLCVDPALRGIGIGYELLTRYIDMMIKRGYHGFHLDCLKDNVSALQPYNKVGFREISEGYGFNAPESAKPEILHLLLKS